MKKSELLVTLSDTFYKVGTLDSPRVSEGINWYTVGVYEKGINTLIRKNLSFYVVNEGKTTEEAYWHESNVVKPVLASTPTFSDAVKTYIKSKKGVGLLSAQIESISEDEKWAIVKAIIKTTTITEKRYYVSYVGDVLTHELIV